MKRSFREILADSHTAAVTIAVLLVWSLDGAFRAVWGPAFRAVSFLVTAVAIFNIPYFSPTLDVADRLTLIATFSYLYSAAISLLAACLLSRWVYGVGPLRSLMNYRSKLTRRRDA
ncbi:MAG: hypothetical protein WBD25_15565 [Terriglobales bacterium]|jgi:hypothetical protein